MEALNVLFSGANLLYVCFIAELPLEKYGGSLITVNIFHALDKMGVISSEKTCSKFVYGCCTWNNVN